MVSSLRGRAACALAAASLFVLADAAQSAPVSFVTAPPASAAAPSAFAAASAAAAPSASAAASAVAAPSASAAANPVGAPRRIKIPALRPFAPPPALTPAPAAPPETPAPPAPARAAYLRPRAPAGAPLRISGDFRPRPGAPRPAPRGEVEHAFFADPLDPAPLGDRHPMLLVHGFDSEILHLPFDPDRNEHWEAFRFHPFYKKAQRFFKFYIFTYRPYADLREVGAWLNAELKDHVLPEMNPGQGLSLMTISGGALVGRYAVADPAIAPEVRYIFTLNGANRGSVLASLAGAKKSIKKKIGWLNAALLRWSRKGAVISPGVRSLAYDNFDGTIDEESETRHGMIVNHALREFNETDPNRHKVVAYQCRPGRLLGKGKFGIDYHMRRRMLRKFHPSWGTVDPIIHKRSGLLEGVGLVRRRFFTGLDHWGIADKRVMATVFQDIGAVIRTLKVPGLVQ